ncbi:hypothetical protein KAW08_05530 [bacterium]|nr:hypothetical protein [bacterium]
MKFFIMVFLGLVIAAICVALACVVLVILNNQKRKKSRYVPDKAGQLPHCEPISDSVKKDILKSITRLSAGEIIFDNASKLIKKKIGNITEIDSVLKMVVDKKILPDGGLKLISALVKDMSKRDSFQKKIARPSKGILIFGLLIILFNLLASLIIFRNCALLPLPSVFRLPLFSFAFILNILSLLCGVFILRLKEWARWVMLGLCIFNLFIFIPICFFAEVVFLGISAFVLFSYPAYYLIRLFPIVWSILILIFFTRPSVKEQFGVFAKHQETSSIVREIE